VEKEDESRPPLRVTFKSYHAEIAEIAQPQGRSARVFAALVFCRPRFLGGVQQIPSRRCAVPIPQGRVDYVSYGYLA
jgi:hypothetical protein